MRSFPIRNGKWVPAFSPDNEPIYPIVARFHGGEDVINQFKQKGASR